MARRPPAPGSSVLPHQTRQNEYFVPRDGIDREVITADICRYLGNDALVRPGNYEACRALSSLSRIAVTRSNVLTLQNPENGQIIQGYFINAYRNLTSAMIQDLKADSARWDQERRQQSANRNSAGGGTIASNGVLIRSSNTPPVQYRNSDIHQSRQYYGPTEASYSGTAGSDPFDSGPGPRYPGTGSAGFTGAASSYSQQYAASPGGYTQQGYTANTTQFAPPQANVPSYGAGHSVPPSGYSQNPPYNIVGQDLRASTQSQADSYGNDPYGTSRDPRGDPRDQRVPVTTTMAPARATYVTAGPPSTQPFSAPGQNPNYYSQSAAPIQPGDPFYGRASPAGTASYPAASDQQYESTPAHKRSGSSQSTQLPTSGSSRHRSDRDSVERHDQRHVRPRAGR
ncbi:hypothetical protein NUW58_g7518 [Xylaria curta]|uniref:Uncharacterized protein n=1 Tax=Xylaria curta TaxID=42375 RepID=A0ACC1NH47_9PEZI|nr:hypothetical protein NUW58_g7518 [Xylaria curta]